MTFFWLIFWLFNYTPSLDFSGSWNNWAIALVICGAIDVLAALSRSSS